MREPLFAIGSVFIPLVFGLVPAFLPRSVASIARWLLWLGAVAATGWYVHQMRDMPDPYPALALGFVIVSAALSLVVLIVEPGRRPSPRRG